MKMTLGNLTTFAASVVVGCTAAVAFASVAAVTQVAPALLTPPAKPVEVIRLEPVVVTVSKATYDALRAQDTAVPRTNAARKENRGSGPDGVIDR